MANVLMRAGVAMHTGLYRALGGRLVGRTNGCPLLLLTTTGRKSGKRRSLPLAYLEDEGRYLLAGSAGGSPRHPAWLLNLQASETARIQIGRESISVGVQVLTEGPERDALWGKITSAYAPFSGYEAKTERVIPVAVLKPR